jgi:hypothetical protein
MLGVLMVLGDLLADLGRRQALGHLSNSGLDGGGVLYAKDRWPRRPGITRYG